MDLPKSEAKTEEQVVLTTLAPTESAGEPTPVETPVDSPVKEKEGGEQLPDEGKLAEEAKTHEVAGP